MNKAFLFDMDGVLVDSERLWEPVDTAIWSGLIGSERYKEMGSVLGMDIRTAFSHGQKYGLTMSYDDFVSTYDREAAEKIYSKAALSSGIEELSGFLVSNGYRIGVISSSRQNWIDQVIPRLPFKNEIEVVISLSDRPDLKPKPNPDGYLEALRELSAEPKQSFVLEDTNRGIQSGKSAGCYVIGYRALLVPNYEQAGADAYADTMADVQKIVEELIRR